MIYLQTPQSFDTPQGAEVKITSINCSDLLFDIVKQKAYNTTCSISVSLSAGGLKPRSGGTAASLHSQVRV